ncbi:hypothetical protein IHE45_10G019700 [Dioscorea alata]|uniref:Uncharacterized protein n=2 Tax=Dioscorea alata TaxID=55571 RepID=A0ACB7V9Q7_DIOAL|nr:hypothetical protein IHE45_10G019700 [Dioscorea alata]KAH7670349.1 hypothetical protein IHE45_10G019700 [Dioscorea alata]
MRFHLGLGSKAKKLFVSSPTKKKPLNGEIQVVNLEPGLGGFRSPDYGSKDETFFDSRAWLDSDCDDDFYSVNGDFTPSRGSTPNHQFGTTPRNKAYMGSTFPNSSVEPSPTERKKKLAELLQESLYSEQISDGQNVSHNNKAPNGEQFANRLDTEHPPKSVVGTPYFSGASSVCGSEAMTPSRDLKHRKERRSSSCCLPSLLLNLTFTEKRRQKMSPEHGRG